MQHRILHFPAIEKHGAIGDRRTGALVAADGTIDWLCVPDFDGPSIFGALLDPERGGCCRLGPLAATPGEQRYLPETATLLTTWLGLDAAPAVELSDVMAHPEEERPDSALDQRIILRRVRVLREAELTFVLQPRHNFTAPITVSPAEGGVAFQFSTGTLGCWASFPLKLGPLGATARLTLAAGEEHWVVVGWMLKPEAWSATQAAQHFAAASDYWRHWAEGLQVPAGGSRSTMLKRSAITVQLLSHVHYKSTVAALTTSLPERLGGSRNYDYRYAWVRDASLSLALLARMGKEAEVQCYLHWLCRLDSTTESPLQVCYRLDGGTELEQEDLPGIRGYAERRPVRRGNRAARQRQLGSLGFFTDCLRLYLEHGGEWKEEFWSLLHRVAEYTCDHWPEKDSGVWELPNEAHYVASRVMSWVVLDRAIHVAEQTDHAADTERWRTTAAAIHEEVMVQGWCVEKNSFRQRYGSDALDAAALLIPLMGFLPAEHPRVAGTLAAIERELMVDGLVHRFNPQDLPGGDHLSIGREEGAFLPCVFWHAQALARAGRCDEAEAILSRCEAIAGEPGLFAEEADARHHTFLGNTPLLFSHVEYVRAATALQAARARAAAFNDPI